MHQANEQQLTSIILARFASVAPAWPLVAKSPGDVSCPLRLEPIPELEDIAAGDTDDTDDAFWGTAGVVLPRISGCGSAVERFLVPLFTKVVVVPGFFTDSATGAAIAEALGGLGAARVLSFAIAFPKKWRTGGELLSSWEDSFSFSLSPQSLLLVLSALRRAGTRGSLKMLFFGGGELESKGEDSAPDESLSDGCRRLKKCDDRGAVREGADVRELPATELAAVAGVVELSDATALEFVGKGATPYLLAIGAPLCRLAGGEEAVDDDDEEDEMLDRSSSSLVEVVVKDPRRTRGTIFELRCDVFVPPTRESEETDVVGELVVRPHPKIVSARLLCAKIVVRG